MNTADRSQSDLSETLRVGIRMLRPAQGMPQDAKIEALSRSLWMLEAKVVELELRKLAYSQDAASKEDGLRFVQTIGEFNSQSQGLVPLVKNAGDLLDNQTQFPIVLIVSAPLDFEGFVDTPATMPIQLKNFGGAAAEHVVFKFGVDGDLKETVTIDGLKPGEIRSVPLTLTPDQPGIKQLSFAVNNLGQTDQWAAQINILPGKPALVAASPTAQPRLLFGIGLAAAGLIIIGLAGALWIKKFKR
jgi:hypothetical protein